MKKDQKPPGVFHFFQGRLALVFLFLGLCCLAVVAAWLVETRDLLKEIRTVRPGPILSALIAGALSYGACALSFGALFSLSRARIPFGSLFAVTLISSTVNSVVSSGGLSSLAVRSFLMKVHRVPHSLTVPISVAQTLLMYLVLALFCLGGLGSLKELEGAQSPRLVVALSALTVGLWVLVFLWAAAFFHEGARRILWRLGFVLAKASEKITGLKKVFNPKRWLTFQRHVEESLHLIHRRLGILFLSFFWVVLDWVFAFLCLLFCFHACGLQLSWSVLLVVFMLVLLTVTVNVIPGGLGITEGIVVTFLSHMGYDPEKSLVSIFIFRMIYFVLPLAVSAALYMEILNKVINKTK